MNEYRIPFNKPAFLGTEHAYILEALRQAHLSGDGPFTRQCHAFFERHFHIQKSLLTTSCTHALEMASILLDIQSGDEVIVPAYTFVSTVNAFVLRGAKPVFVDIRRDTLNLDENLLERHICPKTKAIIVVHYAGVACEMDAILAIAARHGVAVVEDNAHGLFGKYRGRHLGTLGQLATHSFHETKNVTCGEGGCLFINDPMFIERAEIIREKGTDRSRFFRGQVDKYGWVDIGSSYLPSDLLAAHLLAQLEGHDIIQKKREFVWRYYQESLSAWSKRNGVMLPSIPAMCDQAFHMFYLLMPSLSIRQDFIRHMREQGILAVFHYLPLHLSPMGARYGYARGACPVTEEMCDRLVRLPLYYNMTEVEMQKVVSAVQEYQPAMHEGVPAS